MRATPGTCGHIAPQIRIIKSLMFAVRAVMVQYSRSPAVGSRDNPLWVYERSPAVVAVVELDGHLIADGVWRYLVTSYDSLCTCTLGRRENSSQASSQTI